MFYSQFILAKKGPLGTIWIAAHLERKLRKNQVADTDIGVSVDSILFPEVPIALRLSSHLLLGVVRIYSRKVNYLFDDCSEALLKIKQAFRSTAVDLPPEESTAPYHSITLPETFDLDDFELPDNEIFQGNYVDHHVSTKEQITLQDTMEGVVYSTSQFGLDERFGDGDTSQIGLDLDEELLLNKVVGPGHDGISDADPQVPVQSETTQTKYESDEVITETSEVMHMNGGGNQVDVLATDPEIVEYAQAPSTPGLLEEPNLSSVQETLACDDHMELDHTLTGLVASENTLTASGKSDFPGDKNTVNWSLRNDLSADTVENGCLLGDQDIKQAKPQEHLPPTEASMEYMLADNCLSTSLPSLDPIEQTEAIHRELECSDGTVSVLDGPDKAEDIHNGVVIDNEPGTSFVHQTDVECVEPVGVRLDETVASPSCSHITSDFEDPSRKTFSSGIFALESEAYLEDDQASPRPEILNDVEIANDVGRSCSTSKASASNAVCPLESPGRPEVVNVEAQACQELKETETSDPLANDVMQSNQSHVLRACNAHQSQPDLSSLGGEECLATDVMDTVLEKNSESAPYEEIQSDSRKLDGQMKNAVFSNSQLNNLSSPQTSDFPAPEKMLSVVEALTTKQNDLLVNSTPDKEALAGDDGAAAGIELISGKKRSFTESTLTVQSVNSVESFGMTQSKKTAESVPDDDDLLSSILVGRRSSALKMKPTPPAPEVVPVKRLRSAPRSSALKRKVLMDDTMVLHGDTIRLQLTNTEDIRRVRKKAPCTRPEISTILRQFLEDEIFNEPLCTGMSANLIFLHSETFDLSGIRISENDQGNNSEVAKDMESSVRPNVTEESEMDGTTEPVVVRSDIEAQPADNSIQTERQQVESFNLGLQQMNSQEQPKAISDIQDFRFSQHDPLGEFYEMGTERGNVEAADAVNGFLVNGLESLSATVPVSGYICNVPVDFVVQPSLMDKTDDASASLPIDASCMSPGNKLDAQTVEGEAFVVNMSNGNAVDAIEIVEHGVEISAHLQPGSFKLAENIKDSLASECHNLAFENGDQPLEETRNDKPGVLNEDGGLPVDLGCDDKDSTSNFMRMGEMKIDSTHSVDLDLDVNNASLNVKENADCQEAEPNSIMDGEVPALDCPGVEDRSGFEDVTVGNDTEFLNVDDEEIAEEEDDNMPSSTEDTRLLENTGWSSRTRAVAKYLQTLFDKEAVHGRKTLPMDNLLAGKTRKEASRMFFETLVLKTRDYIHVEQAKPFDSINIKPRVKLMKSDF
ncbi:hypothetical protein CMV_000094 [Castanea mollissima]|uniref:Sister chromatid cohesion 1 protein 4-like n=1 Tax=Castanea mollissima TaxID=60419 RepID=A0A8J4VXZ3_9ROSI|nr:hypothetical protein CMV_000094 [Castanea mollissima]